MEKTPRENARVTLKVYQLLGRVFQEMEDIFPLLDRYGQGFIHLNPLLEQNGRVFVAFRGALSSWPGDCFYFIEKKL